MRRETQYTRDTSFGYICDRLTAMISLQDAIYYLILSDTILFSIR